MRGRHAGSVIAVAVLVLAATGCSVLDRAGLLGVPKAAVEAEKLLEAGDEAGAVRQLDSLIRERGSDAGVFILVARACALAQRPDLTVRYAKRGLAETDGAAAPAHAGLYGLMGIAYQEQGDHEQAVNAYRAALRLLPDEPGSLNNLAYAYAEMPDGQAPLAEAERLAAEAVRLAAKTQRPPEEMGIYLDTLGWVQFRAGNLQMGLVHLSQAADAVPGQPDVLYHLARVYEALGRLFDARVMLQRALKVDPAHVAARRTFDELRIMMSDADLGPDGTAAKVPASIERGP